MDVEILRWVTLVIAVVALVQPWIFRRLRSG